MDYSDSLQHLIAAYDSFFEPFAVLGSALFGAALFIYLRKNGVINDSEVDLKRVRPLIFLAGVCGIALIFISYLSDARLLAFHFYMSESGSQTVASAYQSFVQDYKPFIVTYQILSIFVALVGMSAAVFSLIRSSGPKSMKGGGTQ